MGDDDGIVERAISSLGKGFDLTSDFRLKYCKGNQSLVLLNQAQTRNIVLPCFGSFNDISIDIKFDKGEQTRYQSDFLDFNHMSEFFNQKSSVVGKIPSGLFNSTFGFQSGSWATDAANTKCLGLDGYFVKLFSVNIDRYQLNLSDEVRRAVPSTWDPPALARFIENFGTHIVVGLSIGGQHVVVVRQDKCSNLEPSELKKHLKELGDQMFTGKCMFSPFHSKTKEIKHKVPEAFNIFDPTVPISLDNFSSVSAKDGITVICSKKGGVSTNFHSEWLLSVPSMPDAIQFSFIPITSVLRSDPGKGFLSHAINLYLRYKPPVADLAYFLDFQTHKNWAPSLNELPLGPSTNLANRSLSLHFNFMGPKLYVNHTQVIVGKKPVVGLRLYLEGKKCNRLAIHLQHLINTPTMLENKISEIALWQGSENVNNERFLEAINGRKFSHVCTAPVKYNAGWKTQNDVAFIVTGAQLHVKKQGSENVLHLRLLFSKVSDFFVVKSNWVQGSSEFSQKSLGIFSAISTSLAGNPVKEKGQAVVVDSSVFPTGPPVPVGTQKFLQFVEMSQIRRGPENSPGYWLVTGAKLTLEKGKICLHVKFSLLNICS